MMLHATIEMARFVTYEVSIAHESNEPAECRLVVCWAVARKSWAHIGGIAGLSSLGGPSTGVLPLSIGPGT